MRCMIINNELHSHSYCIVTRVEITPTPVGPLVTAPRPQTTTRLPPTREKPRPFSPRPTTATPDNDNRQSESGRVPQIVVASAHPQDNEIPDSVHVHNNLLHNGADLPSHSTDDRKETFGARLNLGENSYIFTCTVLISYLRLSGATTKRLTPFISIYTLYFVCNIVNLL